MKREINFSNITATMGEYHVEGREVITSAHPNPAGRISHWRVRVVRAGILSRGEDIWHTEEIRTFHDEDEAFYEFDRLVSKYELRVLCGA